MKVLSGVGIIYKPMKRIKKTDLISDVLANCPQASEVFTEYELHCATCFLGQFETIEEGAQLHGMNDQQIEEMINKINIKLKKK